MTIITSKSNDSLLNFITVACFGTLGAVSRYGMGIVGKAFSTGFPWGTLCVNAIGCFLLGWIAVRWQPSSTIATRLKLGVTTGFLGAFTTYSAFAVESIGWLNTQHYGVFTIHLLANLVGGLALASMGVWVAGRRRVVSSR